MAESSTSPSAHREQILHRAARIEDAFHRWRERGGRRRGLKTTILPYAGYGSAGWMRVLCRVVLTRGEAARQRAEKVRGWRSFFSIPITDVEVVITVGEVEHRVFPERGGIVDTKVPVDLVPGWHEITLRTDHTEPVTARIFIADAQQTHGLLSDVDDTVMVTALPRPFVAAWNTFVVDVHARTPVPGMAVLYERVTREYPDSPIIYLSTGAWNVAPTLSMFLERNLYPRGAMLLTDWGPTKNSWFRSGRDHKRSSLERLAHEFPSVRWLLVGDDGQHDEAIYEEFATAHPDNVAAIAIRQLSTAESVLAGGRSAAADRAHAGGAPWFYAPDGAGLAEQLAAAGLLPDSPR